jgi:hypothetical protein
MSSSDRTQRAKPWNPHTAAPTSPVTEREDAATSRATETRHRVKRQSQASLHPQQNRPQEQLQPANRSNPGHSTTCHATTTPHNNHTLWSPRSFSGLLQSLSDRLHRGVMWEPPTARYRHCYATPKRKPGYGFHIRGDEQTFPRQQIHGKQ